MIKIGRKYELACAASDAAHHRKKTLKNPPVNEEEEEFYRDYYECYVDAIKNGQSYYVYCYDDDF